MFVEDWKNLGAPVKGGLHVEIDTELPDQTCGIRPIADLTGCN